VQSVVGNATLYSADTGAGVDGSRNSLAKYTFLRVLGNGTSRLAVLAYDTDGNPTQQGWVDPNQVLPSAPGTGWLVSASATTLWSSAGPDASSVRQVAQFSPLLAVDNTIQQDRVQVRVYRADFSGVLDQGWVDVSATGPAYPPQTRIASPTGGLPAASPASTTLAKSHVAFLQAAGEAARLGQTETGVPASVTVAQAILESSWGQSALALDANNYFGIKAMGSEGTAGVVWMPTSEYDDSGQLYQTMSAFRAYNSLTDSLEDHDVLLESLARYAPAMQAAHDPKQFAALIAQEGYSTDPAYADKLVQLMDSYNLYQFDA
jgi:hypothetical protein